MDKRILDLKQKLLTKQLTEDTDYLTKYLDLIQANLNTTQVKHVTQKHHVIPVIYYKHFHPIEEVNGRSRHRYEQLADSDPDNFLINLT